MNKTVFFIIFLIGCSSDADVLYDNYPNVLYSCEPVACGNKPEYLRCENGELTFNLKCLFRENIGCEWMPVNCK
jgi:hypothetical protein